VKIEPDCLPCMLGQALRLARAASENDWLHRRALNETLGTLGEADPEVSPADLLGQVIKTTLRTVGSHDPCAEQRLELARSLKLFADELREFLVTSKDPLASALSAAAAANQIDRLALGDFDALEEVRAAWEGGASRIDVSALDRLRKILAGAKRVLFIHDNAGELEVDQALVELLRSEGKEVTRVVREPGLLHDATAADTVTPPMQPLLPTGTAELGTPVVLCCKELREALDAADLVIAKGSANLQTLRHDATPVAFLLAAKCGPVARFLGVPLGSSVLVFSDELPES